MMMGPNYWNMWQMMSMMKMGGYWSPLLGMNPPPGTLSLWISNDLSQFLSVFENRIQIIFTHKLNTIIFLIWMIFRKPTVIQIKAEEDMQDIQPPNRNPGQFTPSNPLKGRLQEMRNQMDIERSNHTHSPYNNSDLLYQSLMNNNRD